MPQTRTQAEIDLEMEKLATRTTRSVEPLPIPDDPQAFVDAEMLLLADPEGGDGLTPQVDVSFNYNIDPEGAFDIPIPEQGGVSHRQNLNAQNLDMIQIDGKRYIVPIDERKRTDLMIEGGRERLNARYPEMIKGIAALPGEITSQPSLMHMFGKAGEMLYEGVKGFGSRLGEAFTAEDPKVQGGAITDLALSAGEALAVPGLGKAALSPIRTLKETVSEAGAAAAGGMLKSATPSPFSGAFPRMGVREFRALRTLRKFDMLKGEAVAGIGIDASKIPAGLGFDPMESLETTIPHLAHAIRNTDKIPELGQKKLLRRWMASPDLGQSTRAFYELTQTVADKFWRENYQYIAQPFKEVVIETAPLVAGLRKFADGDFLRILDPKVRENILGAAERFDRTMTLDQLEGFRRDLNKLINPNGEIPKAHMEILVGDVRDLIDSKLDQLVTRDLPTSRALQTYKQMVDIRDWMKERAIQVRLESYAHLAEGKHIPVPTFVTETGIKAQLIRSALRAVTPGRKHPDELLRNFYNKIKEGPKSFGGEPIPITILRTQRMLTGRGGQGARNYPTGYVPPIEAPVRRAGGAMWREKPPSFVDDVDFAGPSVNPGGGVRSIDPEFSTPTPSARLVPGSRVNVGGREGTIKDQTRDTFIIRFDSGITEQIPKRALLEEAP